MGRSLLWRQQLLGSLQGQLQLATYLAVFVGFTGASIAGLWIGGQTITQSVYPSPIYEGPLKKL